MPDISTTPLAAPYGPPRQDQLLKAFHGRLAPVQVGLGYKLGLSAAAFAMVLLPLVYLGLIGFTAYGVYWHATHNLVLFDQMRGKTAAFLYGAPLIVGAVLVFFLIKPLLAPKAAAGRTRSLSREEEPVLHAFVEKLCATVGAPMPSRIDVDCEVNASASLRRGFWSLLGKRDLVLTVGLPLVQGLRLDQMAGVLAHEFGHFAQGAGMGLSYVVRSVNIWFARVVYGRDRWDQELEDAANTDTWWVISVVIALARGAVWCSRKILAGLMHMGHAISCYLMRQMEFDADRYETRLVGAETFETTCRELGCLNVAFQRSIQAVSFSWREGYLADNLPGMMATKRRGLEREVLDALGSAIDQSETRWFDTHPADRERIASARRESHPVIFRSDLPAEVLFRDFASLARTVSQDLYQEKIGQEIPPSALVAVDDLVARQDSTFKDFQATTRVLRAPFDNFEPPLWPAGSEQPEAIDRATATERLEEIRGAQLAADVHLAQVWAAYDAAIGESLPLAAADTLLDLGYSIAPGAFGMADTSRLAITNRRIALDRVIGDSRPTLEASLERARARVLTALAFAAGTEPDAPIQESRRRLEGSLTAVMALAGQRERFCRFRADLNIIRILVEALQNKLEAPQKAQERVQAIGQQLVPEIAAIKAALEGIPHPFETLESGTTLGSFLVPKMPPPGELADIFDAAQTVLNQGVLVGNKAWGRIAAFTEEVEAELLLPELEIPKAE